MLRTKIYYRVKRFIPPLLRTAIRRAVATRLRSQVTDVWPIMPGSERVPEQWPGWPEGKRFAFVLTHDVEGPAGLKRCQPLMQLEQEYGFRSSFNFIPEGNYRVPPELREQLGQNGFEVGVHDLKHDGSLYRSRREFRQSAARINRYLREWNAAGFRSGFMLHNLDWLHQLEIKYDASTFDSDPFEPQPEGRHTIFPFFVPRVGDHDDGAEDGAGYVEFPYTLPQDSTLFLLLGEKSPEIWLRKLDWIAEHGGMALVNIHPDYMDFSGKTKRSTYPSTHVAELLQYVREKYAGQFWNPLPKELASWYAKVHRQAPLALEGANGNGELAPGVRDLQGKRAAVLLYSYYPADPRPRRAAAALVNRGMEVDLICLRENENEPLREMIDGVSVLRLPWRKTRNSKLGYIRQYSRFLTGCFGLLTHRSWQRRYDLVHVHNMPDVLVFAALAPKLFGARVILDLHDPMPELMMSIYKLPERHRIVRWLKRLEKMSIGFADLVLTPNIAFRDLFVSRGCPPERIQIVMNSPQEEIFDPEQFRGSASANGASSNGHAEAKMFRLMYHGSLVHRHGLDIAVRAIDLVRKKIPAIQLDIFGYQTDYLDSVLQLARELGVERLIAFHGSRPQTEIARHIAGCNLGIIPNRFSPFTDLNFPTRIFEYLAMNRPVIVPATRGIKDYFAEGSLIFFKPDSEIDLAEKIGWVHDHPAETAAIVERGQAVYRQHMWRQQRLTLQRAASKLVR